VSPSEIGKPARWRLPAEQIEEAVRRALLDLLSDEPAIARDLAAHQLTREGIAAAVTRANQASSDLKTGVVPDALQRIELHQGGLRLSIHLSSNAQDVPIVRFVPMQMRKRGIEMRLVLESGNQPAQVDPTLIRAIARARGWLSEICSGTVQSQREIAAREGITDDYVNQLMPLAFLAPNIVEAIVAGRQPPHLSTKDLMIRLALPDDWAGQHRLLGVG
jgi:hypothetical protein